MLVENRTNSLAILAKGKINTSEGQMSDVAHASEYIREAFPKESHGTVQAACWAAYRKLKLSTERRARAIWNGEAKRIDAHEMEALKQAAVESHIAKRNAAVARIAALEQAIRVGGADVHSGCSTAAGRTD